MPLDPAIFAANRAATERIRALAARLSDAELQHPVGQHWTVAVTLAHLAFWDRRALQVLDLSERDGAINFPELDIFVNDLSLTLWKAVPPREAARIAIESAQALDARMEHYPPALLDAFYAESQDFVSRSKHRNRHLDEAETTLTGAVFSAPAEELDE